MPIINCSVPPLINDCTGGKSHFTLEAETLEQALSLLQDTYPLLRIHLYTEAGDIRQHVLFYYNNDNIAWLDRLDIPLRTGDRLTVLQAVSGG